jgi:hypothetical protein
MDNTKHFDFSTPEKKKKTPNEIEQDKAKAELARQLREQERVKYEFKKYLSTADADFIKNRQADILAFTRNQFLPSTVSQLLKYPNYIESQLRLWWKYGFDKEYKQIWQQFN